MDVAPASTEIDAGPRAKAARPDPLWTRPAQAARATLGVGHARARAVAGLALAR
jgi:hypothetical protein